MDSKDFERLPKQVPASVSSGDAIDFMDHVMWTPPSEIIEKKEKAQHPPIVKIEDNIEKHVTEILEAWAKWGQLEQDTIDNTPKEDVDVRLARMLESQTLPTTSHKSNYTEEEKRIREAILAQYSQMSDQEESEGEGDDEGIGAGGGGDAGLEKNTNAATIVQAEREKRERAKLESQRKKDKDKEDREKQKQLKEEKKEKRKTQKGERRR